VRLLLCKQLALEAGWHWHRFCGNQPGEISPKPPPVLQAALWHLLSVCWTISVCEVPHSFVLGSFMKQHLGYRASQRHRQGPGASTRRWAPGQQERARCWQASRGRPKRCSNPTGLSVPSPYLSLKGNFKPFKMASSGFQGDSAKVITAMETLSLA